MMIENNFKMALREGVSREFSNIPMHESEISYVFSDNFLCKMDKLTRQGQNRFWRMTNTVSKRAAVIFASILIALLTACSFPPVRAAVTNFFQETYDNCIRFFTGNVGTEQISEHYFLIDIPEGFSEIETTENDACYIHMYQNDARDKIILSQSIAADYAVFIDNEHGEISNVTIQGMDVSIYDSAETNCRTAIWLKDGYAFELTVYGDYDLELIIQLVSSVERQ